ncbi:MAG: hypothetical protein SPI34_01695 [Opitutales bacterium]|nr:hypothetical protein [Opitutales bacterium]
MKELDIAQDTTATGFAFTSVNKGKTQTEFIKKYNTGGKEKFYYTARRGKAGYVYSWYELTKTNYKRKHNEWEAQQEATK